jgi:putative copper export protein
MFWVGGMLFYVLVLISIIRDPEFKNIKLRLLEKTAVQFRKVSYYVFIILLLSGSILLYSKGMMRLSYNIYEMMRSISILFQLKISLFLLLLASSVYHDFFTGPKTIEYAESNPTLFEKFRKRSALFGKLNLLLSVGIAVLGILGSRGISYFH